MKLFIASIALLSVSLYLIDIKSAELLASVVAPIGAGLSALLIVASIIRFFIVASKQKNVSKSDRSWFLNKNRYKDGIDFNKLGN
ncbi:hypothetical protein KO489_12620 [Reinekea forsetii]|nr:hypothetical protein [Reinekea forsetii]